MNEKLTCPGCGAPMRIGEREPGDKIATCEYCGAEVDLPDNTTVTREKITEEHHSEKGRGTRIEKTSRVIQRTTTARQDTGGTAGVKLPEGFDTLFANLGEGERRTVTVSADGTRTIQYTTGDKVEIPEDLRKIVADAGIDLDAMIGGTATKQAVATKPTTKLAIEIKPEKPTSWWRRMFGKKS